MKEIFDENQYIDYVTKETAYFYFPKTFIDLLCNMRFFFSVFDVFFMSQILKVNLEDL